MSYREMFPESHTDWTSKMIAKVIAILFFVFVTVYSCTN